LFCYLQPSDCAIVSEMTYNVSSVMLTCTIPTENIHVSDGLRRFVIFFIIRLIKTFTYLLTIQGVSLPSLGQMSIGAYTAESVMNS